MGFFGGLIKGIVRGARSLGKKAVKGLKGLGEKVVKGVKGGVKKVKDMFKKTPKKDWKEGDSVKFADVGGGNKMAYRGGKPVTGEVIRGRGLGDRIKGKGEGSKTFSYIDNLTDPESILL